MMGIMKLKLIFLNIILKIMTDTTTNIKFDSAYHKLSSDIRNTEHEISLRKKQLVDLKSELSEMIMQLNKFDTSEITSNK